MNSGLDNLCLVHVRQAPSSHSDTCGFFIEQLNAAFDRGKHGFLAIDIIRPFCDHNGGSCFVQKQGSQMSGAMAGSAILNLSGRSSKLRMLTITVNNSCNLSCPHCYLQYDKPDGFISNALIAKVCATDCAHVAIVGMEPLVNSTTAQRTEAIIQAIHSSGKSVSLITNGHGLHYLSGPTLACLTWMDVSFDGGPNSYQKYRGASYIKLCKNLAQLATFRHLRVNALHTVNSLNYEEIDDMMAVSSDFDFEKILFSPYIPTFNNGSNPLSSIPIELFLASCSRSTYFRQSAKSRILLSTHLHPRADHDLIRSLLVRYDLVTKCHIIDVDPLTLGLLRITYDGLVLSPLDSAHPATYAKRGYSLNHFDDITNIYNRLLNAA